MKPFSFTFSPVRLAHALLSTLLVLVLSLIMRLIGPDLLGEGVIALLYLAPIGWCTVRWGQVAGVSAALTAALAFDFLFIPPYWTFTIGSPQGWLLLVLFIAASILVVGRIQTVLSDEQTRERKATFLYEMVVAIANQQTREGIARIIAGQIQEKYLADRVQILLNSRGKLLPLTIAAGNDPEGSNHRKPDRSLPIFSGPALIGEIAIWKGLLPLPSADDLMLQTLLHQTAAALDRAQTAEEGGLSIAGL